MASGSLFATISSWDPLAIAAPPPTVVAGAARSDLQRLTAAVSTFLEKSDALPRSSDDAATLVVALKEHQKECEEEQESAQRELRRLRQTVAMLQQEQLKHEHRKQEAEAVSGKNQNGKTGHSHASPLAEVARLQEALTRAVQQGGSREDVVKVGRLDGDDGCGRCGGSVHGWVAGSPCRGKECVGGERVGGENFRRRLDLGARSALSFVVLEALDRSYSPRSSHTHTPHPVIVFGCHHIAQLHCLPCLPKAQGRP